MVTFNVVDERVGARGDSNDSTANIVGCEKPEAKRLVSELKQRSGAPSGSNKARKGNSNNHFRNVPQLRTKGTSARRKYWGSAPVSLAEFVK